MLNVTFAASPESRSELFRLFRPWMLPILTETMVRETQSQWYFVEMPFAKFRTFIEKLEPVKLLDANLLYGHPNSPTLRDILNMPQELQSKVSFTGYLDTAYLPKKYRLRIRVIAMPRDTAYTKFLERSADTAHTIGERRNLLWF